MRSIRRAAIAGATAATLIMGAATVATAEPPEPGTAATTEAEGTASKSASSDFKEIVSPKDENLKSKKLSARAGAVLEADKPANGARLFGSTDERNKEPKWARYMMIVTYIGAIGSLLGLVVFPAYNFLLANGMLPWSPR